jgi:MarR family transcriptional regulator for hemolysin
MRKSRHRLVLATLFPGLQIAVNLADLLHRYVSGEAFIGSGGRHGTPARKSLPRAGAFPSGERHGRADPMRLRISARELVCVVAVAVGISVVLLLATGIAVPFWRAYEGPWETAPRIYQCASYLNLGLENNVAVWFCSMLLAAIASVALLCFVFDRSDGERSWLGYGWLVMAALFVALSFDELGSLHERMPLPGGLAGQVLWYAPVVAVLPAYMGVFAYSRMRADPVAIGLMALGALMFASIPIQEYFETAVVQRSAGWQRPVLDMLLEEGAELLAMCLILAAFVRYALGFLRHDEAGRNRLAHLAIGRVPLAAWIGIVAAGGLVAGEAAARLLKPDEISGDPRHWFPAFACFAAACLCWLTPRRVWSWQGLVFGQAAALCLAASALVGGHLQYHPTLLPIYALWLAAAWLLGAAVLRSTGWMIGSGLWSLMLYFSLTRLFSPLMPVGIVLSMLLIIATLVLIQDRVVLRPAPKRALARVPRAGRCLYPPRRAYSRLRRIRPIPRTPGGTCARSTSPACRRATEREPMPYKSEKTSFDTYREGGSTSGIRMLIKMVLVVRQFRNTMDVHLRRIGQSSARMEALGAILNMPGKPSQSDLAKRLRVENATVTRMVDILSKEGLVEREPDPTDRRVNLLSVSPKGEEALRDIFAVYDRVRTHILAVVPPERYDELGALFDTMLARLDEPISSDVRIEDLPAVDRLGS